MLLLCNKSIFHPLLMKLCNNNDADWREWVNHRPVKYFWWAHISIASQFSWEWEGNWDETRDISLCGFWGSKENLFLKRNILQVWYRPDVEELQKKLSKSPLQVHRKDFSKNKIILTNFQFVIEYEVARSDLGGEVQLLDGYFVHFVAPENLPPMAKHVIFVLDTSGRYLDTVYIQ